MSIRALRNKIRRDLHNKAKVPAFYISPVQNIEPRLIEVRLHTKYDQTGALRDNKDWIDKREVQPRVIVYNDQVSQPRENAIFSFAQGEAYRIKVIDPIDGETRTCYCVPVPVAETIGLPYPIEGILATTME